MTHLEGNTSSDDDSISSGDINRKNITLTITDNIKVLPNDNDLETTSELAILCKENCPPNQEEELYHLIKSKDDAKLRRWFQSTKGKSAHSL